MTELKLLKNIILEIKDKKENVVYLKNKKEKTNDKYLFKKKSK